jgi:hypothetical protein
MGSGVDATDAIDATDTAMVGETAAASTTNKPKWYILDLTETRVLPITLEISAIPTPSATSFRSCRSCSIDHSLPLKRNQPDTLPGRMPLNIITMILSSLPVSGLPDRHLGLF